jgi:hypothetical protein
VSSLCYFCLFEMVERPGGKSQGKKGHERSRFPRKKQQRIFRFEFI